MKCPNCQSEQHFVIESRSSGSFTRRRRECADCSIRWTTREISLEEIRKFERLEQQNAKLRSLLEESI
jgi:transcriptional regulator NrdR family protein